MSHIPSLIPWERQQNNVEYFLTLDEKFLICRLETDVRLNITVGVF